MKRKKYLKMKKNVKRNIKIYQKIVDDGKKKGFLSSYVWNLNFAKIGLNNLNYRRNKYMSKKEM